MGYFKQSEPRRFNHKYIFVDERKEKLDKIVENAKRDLGMEPAAPRTYEDRIRGTFVGSTTHLKRRKEGGGTHLKTQTIVVALIAALFVLHYLLTGSWAF